ncbi:rough endosperm3 [Zea mays]|uniref:Rough endosperm3 n=1 Tax=Zea mays TaxID=4577 RepID=A0A1D6HAP7_MAIZE|nr:rough endosperm3 [Zea mays]
MSALAAGGGAAADGAPEATAAPTRREKRRERKKERRRRARRQAAARARAAVEAEAPAVDPEEERRLLEIQEAEAAAESERALRAFEDAERRWLEAAAARAAEKAAAAAAEEDARAAEASARNKPKDGQGNQSEEDSEWEYVEDGPAEIIWKGNEIIVKKKKVKVPKGSKEKLQIQEDKAHCPFHLKTGACRFGLRCSRVHFYPDKSITLLMKNMYNGPGLALEQDEGLEFTDEEIEQSYEEFYEDVHTEFLKFGELVNFKITCEFVAVTRWKAAICGEYMRSRYKTCSHGVACNFIHCFRNPGGDYEWADWDNHPPRYWIRKMVALFGPSVDEMNEKASHTPDFRSSVGSDRKKLKISSNRYVSRGSRNEDVHTRHSPQDYSHSKQERSSHNMNYEYRRHKRDSSAADKHRRQDVGDTNDRQFSTMGNDSKSHRHKHEERHRSDHGNGEKEDDSKTRPRKHCSVRRGSLEVGYSDWSPDFTGTDNSKGPSGEKSTSRYDDAKGSRRGSSEYYNLERHHSTAQKQSRNEHSTTRRRRHDIEDYHDEKNDGRGESRKHNRHESNDRWVATNSDVDSDVDRYQSSSCKGTRLGRKDDDPGIEVRHQRSGRSTKDDKRRKHHSGNRWHSGTEEGTSDSSGGDLSSDSWSGRSRNSENFSAHRSKRKRSRSKESGY